MKEADAIATLQATNQVLGDAKLQVDKVGTETDALLAEIEKLQNQAANEELSPEFEAQLNAVVNQANAVKEAVNAVDLKVVDQPPPDVPPGP
jgi:hypothetical protein